MSKRKNLIKALRTAASSLREGIVEYDWYHQQMCNCGVVVQAMLGQGPSEVIKRFNAAKKEASSLITPDKRENYNRTWMQTSRLLCSTTGIPVQELFKELYDKGMTPADINHLEGMSNEAILAKAGIDTADRVIPKKFLSFTYGEKVVENQYWTRKSNLIKYLEAWAEILEGEPVPVTEETDKIELNEQLLLAVADEEYEKAAEIRDKLSKL